MLHRTLAIAKTTFVETLRQPVFSVILACALLLFILSPSIAMYTMDEDIKMLRELGLSTLFLSGLFIAIFSATGALTEEIETKTITTVLSKPISRSSFIMGKFVGLVGAISIAHYISTTAYLLSVRHGVLEAAYQTRDWVVIAVAAAALLAMIVLTAFLNYIYDWNLCATAITCGAILCTITLAILSVLDKEWQFNPGGNSFTSFDIYASVLLLMAIITLIALALLFSTRLNVLLTLLACIAVFMLGLISDYVFGRFADQHLWAKLGKVLVPNFQVFWISDAIYEEATVSFSYLGISAGYAALYTGAILFLTIALFQRRSVG